MNNPKPGFIFDMDGVIVHSNPAHKKAIHIFCEKYGQDVSEEFMENRLYGRTNKEWIPELFGEIEPGRLKELADEKEQLFRDLFAPEDHIVNGILSFLDQLMKKEFALAVATSAPGKNANFILSRLSIEHYFDVILDSSHVTKGKPNPEVYIKASKALNKEPNDCIVFEDSIAGVEAANSAGTTVIGVTTTHSKEEFEGCDLVIRDFEGLRLEKMLEL